MLLTEAIDFLKEKYKGEENVLGIRKLYSVYTTDKDALECPAESGAATELWLSATYFVGEETYVICISFDTEALERQTLENGLADFAAEMKDEEARASESGDAVAYFLELSAKENKEAEEQVINAEKQVNKMLIAAVAVSAVAFVAMIAVMLISIL